MIAEDERLVDQSVLSTMGEKVVVVDFGEKEGRCLRLYRGIHLWVARRDGDGGPTRARDWFESVYALHKSTTRTEA